MDDNRSQTLDMEEFKKATRDYRFDLNEREVELAFKAFDRKNTGGIDYEEFLRTIRGDMNNFRKGLCLQAFKIMDKNGSGEITIDDIRGTYNAKFHPEVKAGKKTEDEVFLEFLETFEQHYDMMAGTTKDGIIQLDEWIEYYENVSMSIDDDAYFELMMNNCWKMNNNTTSNNDKKGWSNNEQSGSSNQKNVQEAYRQKQERDRPVIAKQEEQEPVNTNANIPNNSAIEKFRAKLLSRGAKGIIGIQRQFKIFDDDNSKSLEFEEFVKAVKDFKVDLSQNEIKVVFGAFDRDGQGSINYEEFLRCIRGEMNERRKRIALLAFDKLDRDNTGIIDINDIKYIYNAKNHPEVRSGKKTEEDVFGEFLETFETHHNILKGTRDRRITKEEWCEYYNNVSMSIDSDEYFETMMNNAWKLNGTVTYQKGWAGEASDKQANQGANRAAGQQKQQVYQNAPFGISEGKTNYSTSNRPESSNMQQNKANNFSNVGDDLLIKFREKISARGTRGIFGIRRSFMISDDNNSKTVDFPEFKKLMKDYRYELNEPDLKKLFGIFDSNRNGEIDYEEFLRIIVGEMNDFRKGFAKKAFSTMDKNGNGKLELDDIRAVYNGKQHPEVKAGKKTEDEVLAEFLDNFEYHFSLLVIV
jgi:Ca2+-binding EF-hand superfamily protein